jgi:hypothetical protein
MKHCPRNHLSRLLLRTALMLALVCCLAAGRASAFDSYAQTKQIFKRAEEPVLTVKLDYPSIQSNFRFGYSQGMSFTGAAWNNYVPGNELHAIDVRFGVISILDPSPTETNVTLEPWQTAELRITPGTTDGALYELKIADGSWQTLQDTRGAGGTATEANLKVFATSLYNHSFVEFSSIDVAAQDGSSLFSANFNDPAAAAEAWAFGATAPQAPDLTIADGALTLRSTAIDRVSVISRGTVKRSDKPVLEFRYKNGSGSNMAYFGLIASTLDGVISHNPLAKPYAATLQMVGNDVVVREGQREFSFDKESVKVGEGWINIRISLGEAGGALYEFRTEAPDAAWQTIKDTRGNRGDKTKELRFFFQREWEGELQIDDIQLTSAVAEDFSAPTLDLAKWMPVGYLHSDAESVVVAGGKLRIHGTSVNPAETSGLGASKQEHMQPVWDEMQARLDSIGYPDVAKFEEDADSIRTIREVSTISFNKSNGTIDKVNLRGFPIDKQTLLANLIFSANGLTYEQQYATDCNLKIREEKPAYILEGEFTPVTAEGEKYQFKVRVHHRLDQMNGSLYTKYSFNASGNHYIPVQASMLRIENTMGETPREMNAMQLGYLGGSQNDAAVLATRDTALVERERKEFSSFSWGYQVIQHFIDLNKDQKAGERYLVASRRMHQATWTDGYMGLQIMPITWRHALIDDALDTTTLEGELPYTFVTPYVEPDNRRGLAITFINMPSDTTINSGAIYEQAIALLPAVKPHQIPGFINSNNNFPNINYPSRDYGYYVEWDGKTAEELKQAAVEGTRFMLTINANDTHGLTWDGKIKLFNAQTRYYGMTPIEYTGDMTVTATHTLDGRKLNDEEKKELLIDTRLSHGKNAPENLMEGFHCKQSELARNVFLLHVFNIFNNNGTRGVFFDMTGYFNCSNTRHGCDIHGTYPYWGDNIALNDMRRLADSYPEKRYLLAHNWDSIPFPKIALYDFTLPGEQIGGQKRRKLSYVEENTGYSTLLNGAATILYEGVPASYAFWDDSANKEHTTVIEQALRKVNPAFWCTAKNFRNRSEREHAVLRKYMMPLVIFNTTKSELHHPMDYQYEKYGSASSDVDMLLYSRPEKQETLLVAVNVPHNQKEAQLNVNLPAIGIEGKDVLILDPRTDLALTRTTVEASTLTLTRDLTVGPQILLIKQDTKQPQAIWHQPFVFTADSAFEGNTLKVKLQGVPTADGDFWVYTGEKAAPAQIEGGTLVSFDEAQKLARIKANPLSFTGSGELTLTF